MLGLDLDDDARRRRRRRRDRRARARARRGPRRARLRARADAASATSSPAAASSSRTPPAAPSGTDERPRSPRTVPTASAPSRKRERRDLGQQVEGRQAVRELLIAGRRQVHDLWLSIATPATPRSSTRSQRSPSGAGVRIRRVPADQIERRGPHRVRRRVWSRSRHRCRPSDLDDLLADPHAFLVALDGVTDPQNLGAVMRSAETAGATGWCCATHRAVGLTPDGGQGGRRRARVPAGRVRVRRIPARSTAPRAPGSGASASTPTVTSRCST